MSTKPGELQILAALSGVLLLLAFLVFLLHVVMTLRLKGVLGIFRPSKLETEELVPAG